MSNNPYIYAAIYARQSTRNSKHSIETQISGCTDLAYKNKLMVYKSYSETISATSNNIEEREALSQLLFDAKKNLFKTLVVFKRDRLARNFEDFKKLARIFKRLGIKILFTHDFNAPDDNSSISGFIENILMAVSELEPRTTAMRTKEGLVKMREHGRYHSPDAPFGLKKESGFIDNRIFYKINEAEAIVIRKLFDNFLEFKDNYTPTNLFKTLTKNEIHNSTLTYNNIEKFLLRSVYAGLILKKMSYKLKDITVIDEETDDTFEISPNLFIEATNVEPIISKDLWFKAAKKLSNLKKNKNNMMTKKTTNLFAKKVFCSICNDPLSLSSGYFRCLKCKNKKVSYNYDKLLSEITTTLLNKFFNNNAEAFKNKIIENLIKEYNRDKKNLQSLCLQEKKLVDQYINYKEFTDVSTEIKDLLNKRKQLNTKTSKLDKLIKKLKELKPNEDVNLLSSTKIKLENDEELLKLFIDCFVEKVIIYDKKKSDTNYTISG